MDVTLKNGKHYSITLRAWDGANWILIVPGTCWQLGNLRHKRTLTG